MPEPHELLDEAMKQRRLELRMNWRQLAEAADISYEALRAIRRGDYRPAELTARGIDEALHWSAGSVYAVLDGGTPTGTEEPLSEEPAPTLAEEVEVARRAIAALVDALRLTPAQAEEAFRRVQADVVRTHSGGTSSPPTDRTKRRAM
ncbi:helix-turn-helix transcriptional regulator [Streptomyces sp. NPDC052077]|uniref:helix-turn-helix domain-containing protein n=1 Tax=Streptomyces sp. NPDC052077 TaxID=3154757 RepID=UPI00342CC2F8